MGFFSWLVDDVLGIDLPDNSANEAAAANAASQQQASRDSAAAAARQAAATEAAMAEQTNALRQQTDIARQSADAALAQQKKALAVSEAALIPTIDSESARVAGESRQRKLQSTSPFGIGLSRKLGTAPTGFRVLSGS
ncbi:hypothetical protein ONR75_24100 [Rhodopseudomonas sp. P2A-2r]|uniref:hypothetical protein n=1 Tax=Rhodopseudomonas sp. P2A-2r TaxID=2991972 RepID=UPI002234D411|nr:hypothetical protein [Rhodopseudomonas sp. P2A-2r]UZE47922.1 hypothetical protein ONR75_24100 [Rhodopseudomonas sp. P2A-2r]